MLRAIIGVLALTALPIVAAGQEVTFNVIQESWSIEKSDIVEAAQEFEDGRPIVRIKLAPAAAIRFGEVTGRNVRKVMQVVIGDRILTAPVIMTPITGGELVIQGNFTVQEATELAKRLK